MKFLATSLVLGVALAALPSGVEALGLRGSVIASGATPTAGITSPTHRIYGTVGQPVGGVSGGAGVAFGGSR